jgi:RimJ/RimL family protein N-acetyltransferase
MTLESLTREDAEQIRIWRNDPRVRSTLRTPYPLTREQQEDWYEREICNRESHTRYWALVEREKYESHVYTCDCGLKAGLGGVIVSSGRVLLGYGGIEHISWENRIGELSVLIDPDKWHQGLGTEAVGLFLDQAFNYLNLEAVHGECYFCAAVGFWQKIVIKYQAPATYLPCRKYWEGKFYGSYCFTLFRSEEDADNMRNSGKREIDSITW